MHICKKAVLCIAIIILSMTCMAAAKDRTCEPSLPAQALAKGNNVFALNIYNQLRSAPGNLFFSPVSIRTALAMTYAGARGETASQMKSALSFTLDEADLHPRFCRINPRTEYRRRNRLRNERCQQPVGRQNQHVPAAVH